MASETNSNIGRLEFSKSTRNVILHSGGEPVGVLVDRLADVVAIERSTLQSPPANISGLDARFMLGVHQMENELVVVS